MIKTYKDLLIWQKSVEFVVAIYHETQNFPKSELFGLTSQIRRAAVAIPSNIAEGYARGHTKEYMQFLNIAYASGAECETQLILSHRIGYLTQQKYEILHNQLDEVNRMIFSLIRKLS